MFALVGPTASGKSELAMRVARTMHAAGRAIEVVAVDAFTVYRGMDIATATPSAADRAEVAHHLVDVLDPWEELTVATFQRLARAAIADVRRRGAIALLVGGSGLYLRAVIDDLRFPPTDPTVRARLERRWDGDAAAAHAALAAADPAAAARIDPDNLRRTVRALEVLELTGEPFSAYDDGWERPVSIYPDLDLAYLEPDAEVLRERIRTRATHMIEAGLLDEAAALRTLPHRLSRTAAQAIGYREAFAVLDGHLDVADLPAAIARRTWRYATRQRTWFRADPRCTPREPDEVFGAWTSAAGGGAD